MSDQVSVASFMQVLNATVEGDGYIEFPGRFMPLGRPVQAQGATKQFLMTNKDAATSWHEAVRAEYERQEEEIDHKASTADLPDLVIGGHDKPAEQPRRDAPPAPPAYESLEEELQARAKRWETLMERAQWEIDTAKKDFARAQQEYVKVTAALDAIRGA